MRRGIRLAVCLGALVLLPIQAPTMLPAEQVRAAPLSAPAALQTGDTPTPTPVPPTPASPSPSPLPPTATPRPTPSVPNPGVLVRKAQQAAGRANTYHFVTVLQSVGPTTQYRAIFRAIGDAQLNPYKLASRGSQVLIGPSGKTKVTYNAVRIRKQGWVRVAGGRWQRSQVGHTLTVLPDDPYTSFPGMHMRIGKFVLVRLMPASAGRMRGFLIWHVHGLARIQISGKSVPEAFEDFIRQDTYVPIFLHVTLRNSTQHVSTDIRQQDSNFGERVSIRPPA